MALLLYSCVADPIPINNVPSVALGENGKGYRDNGTGEEGELMRTSVRLYGNCSANQTTNIEKRGFYVSENLEDVQNGAAMEYVVSSKENDFNQNVEGLEIDQTYYFCAFVKDGKKVAKSTISSFHTKAEGFALVNNLSQDGDIIRAKIADDGGSKIKRVGFCWSLKANPDVFEETISAELGEDGYFSAVIPDMEPETTYYFRAFADNGVSGNRISYSNGISIISDPVLIEVDKYNYSVGADGGDLTISITHTYPIDITISTNWIELIDTNTKSASSEKITFNIHPNTGVNKREAKISFSSASGSKNQDIIIVQEAGAFCINIPDVNFKAYCVENFDTDGDGEISNVEALDVLRINVRTDKIKSLQGIECFTNLESLICEPDVTLVAGETNGTIFYDSEGNQIFGELQLIDISQNVSLISISCRYNQLKSLDISQNTKLQELKCSYNQLEDICLPGTSTLTFIDCASNQLSSIDLSKNSELYWLNCDGNNLRLIDLSHNRLLSHLFCGQNFLSELALSNNSKLQYLWCPDNNITSIDFSNTPELNYISCSNNPIGKLNVSSLKSLKELHCHSNNLPELDLSENTILNVLYCSNNNISELHIGQLTSLKELSCGYNDLSDLDVSNNPLLYSLECSGNQLTTLDVSNLTSLRYLSCSNNPYLIEIWLKSGQQIENFYYNKSVTTIYYR